MRRQVLNIGVERVVQWHVVDPLAGRERVISQNVAILPHGPPAAPRYERQAEKLSVGGGGYSMPATSYVMVGIYTHSPVLAHRLGLHVVHCVSHTIRVNAPDTSAEM